MMISQSHPPCWFSFCCCPGATGLLRTRRWGSASCQPPLSGLGDWWWLAGRGGTWCLATPGLFLFKKQHSVSSLPDSVCCACSGFKHPLIQTKGGHGAAPPPHGKFGLSLALVTGKSRVSSLKQNKIGRERCSAERGGESGAWQVTGPLSQPGGQDQTLVFLKVLWPPHSTSVGGGGGQEDTRAAVREEPGSPPCGAFWAFWACC